MICPFLQFLVVTGSGNKVDKSDISMCVWTVNGTKSMCVRPDSHWEKVMRARGLMKAVMLYHGQVPVLGLLDLSWEHRSHSACPPPAPDWPRSDTLPAAPPKHKTSPQDPDRDRDGEKDKQKEETPNEGTKESTTRRHLSKRKQMN